MNYFRFQRDLHFHLLESLLALLVVLITALPALAQTGLTLKPIIKNLSGATAMSVAPTGSIFIVETDQNRILEVDTAGQLLDSLGNYGFGNYQFDEPVDVDATNGLRIYVSDNGNNRIQIFDRHLQYLSSIADASNNPLTNTYYPTQLCIDNRGDLFFYDGRSHYVFSFDHYGKYDRGFNTQALGAIHKPSDMICYGDRLYLADPADGVIHMLSLGGGYLGFLAQAGKVQGIATVGNGIWAVTPNTIIGYDMRGRLLVTKKLKLPDDPVGIGILGSTLYILTRSELLKGPVPQLK
ncbi:MAG TPA: hypothetical protein VKA08_07295 [Balneolales bacterium]|nr:hypothetical protein [Balneolales bacterium]